jgi:LCP family protein required for cell wall assembly
MRYINFQNQNIGRRRRVKNGKRKLTIAIISILLVILVFAFFPPFRDYFKRTFLGPKVALSFIFDDEGDLKKTDGRTNILLLGIGGEGHDGPYLSDSMMVVSVDGKNKDVALISLPRDIWSQDLKAKINAAYAYGEEKKKGGGLNTAKKTVSEISGIPIHYGFRIDFSGFEKAIDLVDGIEVNVDRQFDDYQYPVAGKENDLCGLKVEEDKEATGEAKIKIFDATGSAVPEGIDPFTCRYEHIHFNAGQQKMNGEIALKYVRSRHGTNDEGSDFARAARQQKVLVAFKNKVFTLETLLDPKKDIGLAQSFGQMIDTDIKSEEVSPFLKVLKLFQSQSPRNLVLTNVGENALLENPTDNKPYNGAWVLLPKGGDWSKLHTKIHEFLFSIPQENQKK